MALALSAGFLLLAACDAGDPTSPLKAPLALSTTMGKTDVCHRTTDGNFNKISVADAAYETHIAHGDGGIGEPVPGVQGYVFDDACQPVEAAGLAMVPTSITAGANHTCGVDADGNAYCWGDNSYGQLGNGTGGWGMRNSTPVAVSMPEGESFVAVSAGETHTVALAASGTLYAWGSNYGGLLGDGTTTDQNTPVAVSVPTGHSFVAISVGEFHSLAITTAGVAYGWGFNWEGQLGDGTTTDRSTPVPVDMPAGESLVAISAGREHSVALTATGTAFAWGGNWDGELGDGTTTSKSTPVPVNMPAGENFVSISAGERHTVALTASGAAYAWGEVGTETSNPTSTPIAVAMPAGETFAAISAGRRYTVALTATGVAYAWGSNWNGELGDGTTTSRSTPVALATQERFAAITASLGSWKGAHTAGITPTGAAYAWGSNEDGQLGDGTTTRSNTPVAVSGGITFAY